MIIRFGMITGKISRTTIEAGGGETIIALVDGGRFWTVALLELVTIGVILGAISKEVGTLNLTGGGVRRQNGYRFMARISTMMAIILAARIQVVVGETDGAEEDGAEADAVVAAAGEKSAGAHPAQGIIMDPIIAIPDHNV